MPPDASVGFGLKTETGGGRGGDRRQNEIERGRERGKTQRARARDKETRGKTVEHRLFYNYN